MLSPRPRFLIALAILPIPLLLLAWALWPFVGSSEPKGGPSALRLSPEVQHRLQGLTRLHGPALSEQGLRGRVVVVTFFASWCPPCREELAHLKKIHAAHRARGLEILAINLFEEFDNFSNSKRLAAYLKRMQPGFPVLKGDAEISSLFGEIRRIPALFVFDRSGEPVFHFSNEQAGASTTADPAKLDTLIGGLL